MLTVKDPNKIDWANLPLEECLFGNVMDARMTVLIFHEVYEILRKFKRDHLFKYLLSPALECFAKSEYKGVDIDVNSLEVEDKILSEAISTVEKSIIETIGKSDINIRSKKQLNDLFFHNDDGLQLYPVKKTPKGEPSLDSDALKIILTAIKNELRTRT